MSTLIKSQIQKKMENFNIFLGKEISDSKTFFESDYETTLLPKSFSLADYEVALAAISIQNTVDLDLGTVKFTSEIEPGRFENFYYKIKSKHGESFSEVFKQIESAIIKEYIKQEFRRRLLLRAKNSIKDDVYIIEEMGLERPHFTLLPLNGKDTFDKIVNDHILLSTPRISVIDAIDSSINPEMKPGLVHALNNLNYSISYSGDICLLIPSLIGKKFANHDTHTSNMQYISLPYNKIPSLSTLFLESDLIDSAPYGKQNRRILKYFATKTTTDPQLIEFTNLEYFKVKKRLDTEKMSINISFKDENYDILPFIQSKIKIKLNFRKLRKHVSLFE